MVYDESIESLLNNPELESVYKIILITTLRNSAAVGRTVATFDFFCLYFTDKYQNFFIALNNTYNDNDYCVDDGVYNVILSIKVS